MGAEPVDKVLRAEKIAEEEAAHADDGVFSSEDA